MKPKWFAKWNFSSTVLAWLISALCLMISVPTHAQVVGATLSGTVKDASGSAIPNAQVSVKNVATDTVRELTADSAGFYSVPNLLPGNYEVTFSAQGFATQVASGVTLTVGTQQVLNVTLTVGQISQKVVVTEQAPIVELASSAISGQVTATTVRELPLNGRSWTDLAALSPGVDTIHTQVDFTSGSDRGNRGFGQQLTISGARPQQNNYRLDGVSLNDYANGAPGSVLGGNLGVDAIQEFSVLTSNYSAEYGKTSGGVINAITRSGTNAFHGGAYEFFRNSKLDAANFFESGQRTPFKRNQFGGDIGGPIRKDKTFFFVDYEGIRQAKGLPEVDKVPSDAARGIGPGGTMGPATLCSTPMTASPPNSCTTTTLPTGASAPPTADPTTGIDFKALAYLNKLYPRATGPSIGNGDLATFTFSSNQVINENFVTGRVDQKFSEKDSLFGTYLFDRTPYMAPDAFGNVELGHKTERHFVAVEETHTFKPSFVNSARFGYNRSYVHNNQSLHGLKPGATDTSLGAFTSENRDASFVNITGGGFTPMPGGVGGLPTYFYGWNSFQAYDDAFVTHGTHSLKFGVAVERMLSQSIGDSDPNGVWIFPDVSSFLTNSPKRFQGGVHNLLSPRNLRQTLVGGYVQDDWRIRPSLTLNLGLRYEITTVPTETNGKFIALEKIGDSLPVCGVLANNPLGGTPGCSGTGPLFPNPTLHNFEPRVGFAWDALHNGRLAVRGSAGMFDVLPLPYQVTLMETQASPFFAYTSINFPANSKAFPSAGIPTDLSMLPASKLRSSFFDNSKKRSYVMQWNLNVQYQFTPDLAAMVAYVGSRGVHLPYRVDDADLTLPTLIPGVGYLYPQIDASGNQCLPSTPPCSQTTGNSPPEVNSSFLGGVHGMFYQSMSYYNAFEAQVSKRLSRGLQLQGVFTWAKSIDTSSATVAGDTFANSISSLNWFDVRLTRGLSDFNVGRTFVLNGTWDVPSPKSLSGFARWPLDGWELGLIFTVSDGVPFTATWGTGADPTNSLSQDDFAFPDRLGGSGCQSLVNPGNPKNYIKTQCYSVPTAPSLDFWNAHCDAAPVSLLDSNGNQLFINHPQDPKMDGLNWLPPLPCFNLRGRSGRNTLIGPGVTDLDFSVFKNNHIRRISETANVQFRAEFFNILNHANFEGPTPGDNNTDIFDGTGLASGGAGGLVRTSTPERQIQFALKFVW